jgi:glycosyltransferase involved in cell wall biosynthesis
MKIIQISTFFHPVVGGVEEHVLDLSKELVGLGHEVKVLTTNSTKSGPKVNESYSTIHGIKIIRFWSLFSLSYFHKIFPGIFFYLLKDDFDVIHVHVFRKFESYIALFVGWLRKKPVILTTHNPFPTTTRSKLQKFLIALHDKTVGKLFTKKFSKIIILVESERNIFLKNFKVPKNKLAKIPNGLNEEFFEQGDPKQFLIDWNIDRSKWSHIVTSVGRITYTKGFQNLELAIKKHKKVLFVIAGGDDGYLKELKKIFREYPNVILTERYLPRNKLIELYSASDFFVLPSFHEAFGLVLLEAMAQGLPIISTKIGGPAEFLTSEHGLLIDPHNQKSIADAIDMFCNSSSRLTKISHAVVQEAQKYKWRLIAKKILKIYSQNLDEGKI